MKRKSFWIRVGPKASLVCEEQFTKNRLCGDPLQLALQDKKCPRLLGTHQELEEATEGFSLLVLREPSSIYSFMLVF